MHMLICTGTSYLHVCMLTHTHTHTHVYTCMHMFNCRWTSTLMLCKATLTAAKLLLIPIPRIQVGTVNVGLPDLGTLVL